VQQETEVQQAIEKEQGANNNREVQIEGRAKRTITKPLYLKDFV